MSTTNNQVETVVVKAYVDPIRPVSSIAVPIIEVEELLTGGVGTLSVSVFGGNVKYYLDLTAYKAGSHPLMPGQAVYVSGKYKESNKSFSINIPFETVMTGMPARFVAPYKDALPVGSVGGGSLIGNSGQ